jgi:methylenetetrahydrofolate dehydrogenase (NADP+) / methenyltetrahydrofolate cyclohydrolase
MTKKVNGRKISQKILRSLKIRIANLRKAGRIPGLAVILVGTDRASVSYVARKKAAAQAIGIRFYEYRFPENVALQLLVNKINYIQSRKDIHGVIVQLPVPDRLWSNIRKILDSVDPEKDVDCLTTKCQKALSSKNPFFIPPTPGAILEILRKYKVKLKNKKICIVGRGELIGKPLAAIFSTMPVTVSVVTHSTKFPEKVTRKADILISGVGRPDLIRGDMIKKGAVVIDAGTSFVNDKIQGDVNFKEVSHKASLITSVPGGVGPVTVAKLLENTVLSCERIK